MAQINKPTDYFNTVLYTGTGSSQTPSNGWRPDLSVIKVRSLGTQGWVWADRVRGDEKTLKSNGSDAEETRPLAFSGWTSDGITVVSEGRTNNSGETYANWNWLAGGTTASNTDGSITSTVSANTTSGFSIVSYTGNGSSGSTVGHGLGVAPAMIFVKNRSSANDWNGFHKSLTGTNGIFLNLTSATSASSTFWNNTNPTSSVFTIGNHVTVNTNTNNYIAYCFAEKKGFSKFGSYTGAGVGTFVYTGFKPAWVMIKRTDSTGGWSILDNKRLGYNGATYRVFAHLSNAEEVADKLDLLSNGFRLNVDQGTLSSSGASYIYMAFAESPLVGTNNIPATAR